jgi:hypothetical protein
VVERVKAVVVFVIVAGIRNDAIFRVDKFAAAFEGGQASFLA